MYVCMATYMYVLYMSQTTMSDYFLENVTDFTHIPLLCTPTQLTVLHVLVSIIPHVASTRKMPSLNMDFATMAIILIIHSFFSTHISINSFITSLMYHILLT